MNLMEEDYSSDAESVNSDEELQAAFARGELTPGLVVLQGASQASGPPKEINNVPLLSLKLDEIKYKKSLPWVERLDIVNGPAPLAPEMALEMDSHKTKRERELKHKINQKKKKGSAAPAVDINDDPIHNDFVRETNFYRQAQQAILQCLPRLKELGVPTRRPDDYFAEMAKSDGHMQKVAKVLHKKQIVTEKAEKVRKNRELKKIAKQTQVHVEQQKMKEKKEFMENVKKYRKGQKNNLDFLNEKKTGGKKAGGKINYRREGKNEKYGTGRTKKGSKWNTRESLDSFDDGKGRGRGKGGQGRPGGRGGGQGRPGQKGGKGGGFPRGGGGAKRPGKSNRQKIKAKKGK